MGSTADVALAVARGQTRELKTWDWVLAALFVFFLCVFMGVRRYEARRRARMSEGTGSASTAKEQGQSPPDTLTT